MKRKEAVYKGLQFNDVWQTDTSLTSPDYFQITEFPTQLTAGKNLFKLRGHPTNLKVGGLLNIEVLDYNGDPIYHEVINYIDEDKSRVVAIYIYSETSPGDCTVTLIAEAANSPTEWQGKPNIKWIRSVPVNPNISNVSEIIFDSLPEITLTEEIGPHLDRTYPTGIQFPTYTTGTVRYFSLNSQPAIEIIGGTFTNDMATGTITVANPVNPLPTPNYAVSNAGYASAVKKILSPTTALLDQEYTVLTPTVNNHTYTSFAASPFSLSYEASPVYTQTQNSESYGVLQINNLEPAAGDISRIKVFANNNGTIGTWELLNDVELGETEIFVASTSSIYPDLNVGSFTSQSIINTYWDAHTYQGFTETTPPTLTWSTASMSNAMVISSTTNIAARNAVHVAQIKSIYSGAFISSSAYKITLDAIGTRSSTSNNLDPVLSLYLSGSAVDGLPNDYFNNELPVKLGKRIGELRVTSNNQRFDDITFSFETENVGNAVLLLVVEAGDWQVSDIRTTSDNDAGYTPNYTRLKTLVPTAHKAGNQLSFKIEYYNVAGYKSKQVNYVYNLDWTGGNRYVDGEYSMLTGSLYVADSLDSGIAISGYKKTGFIRSLGYEGFEAGFPGFLIWSGSALSGSLGTKGGAPYSGVGIELYANTASYFRYSTTDSEVDIRTRSFFFGQYPAPFISGANGNIEISASNFHLSANGTVTASNALFTGVALANIIRDKTITITSANSSSYLTTTPVAGVTNPGPPPFIQIFNGYKIILDGSAGGEQVRRVRIDCDLLYPIADFLLPNLSSTAKLDVIVETNRTTTQLYDIFIPPKSPSGLMTFEPNRITLAENAAITFVAGGATGAKWFTTAGTEHPFDHIFRGDVIISGSVYITGSTFPINTAWQSYTPEWTTDGTQPTLGNGSLTGAYKVIGKICFVRVRLYWGTTTNSGTGTFYFSLPVTASTSWGIQMPASILDNGNAWYQATVNGEYGGFTHKTALIGQSAGGANSSQGITGTFPITFSGTGNPDSIQFNGSYEVA